MLAAPLPLRLPVSLLLAVVGGVACGSDASERDRRALEPLTPGPDSPVAVDENGELLLDELTDEDARFAVSGISGEWFTYSDGTSPITPPDHTGLPIVDGAAHVSGTGFSEWGAGLSAYFTSADLSAFDSVVVRVRGNGVIVAEVATPATSPPEEGGTCMGTGCFGHFARSFPLTDTYQDVVIRFAELAQPSWGQPAQLALDGVISLNLTTKVSEGPASIDLWVDRLALHAAAP
ncbi:MAG TPA: hypothetical protein VNN80_26475 [Polyangiaceae bacterium]|nr:hypothetical protein [Polyangiaceae bacterium]